MSQQPQQFDIKIDLNKLCPTGRPHKGQWIPTKHKYECSCCGATVVKVCEWIEVE